MSNIEWEKEGNRYLLYFTPFYDAEIVAYLWQDEDDDWRYGSDILHADGDWLEYPATLDEAKKVMEEKIYEHYVDESGYYKHLSETFKKSMR